jgi:hypothetical protein
VLTSPKENIETKVDVPGHTKRPKSAATAAMMAIRTSSFRLRRVAGVEARGWNLSTEKPDISKDEPQWLAMRASETEQRLEANLCGEMSNVFPRGYPSAKGPA